MTTLLGRLAGLDDEALVAKTNRGMVRRAGKIIGTVTELAGETNSVQLAVGDARVTVSSGEGLKDARCSCPVAGVCVHLVAVCIWARDKVEPVYDADPAQREAPAQRANHAREAGAAHSADPTQRAARAHEERPDVQATVHSVTTKPGHVANWREAATDVRSAIEACWGLGRVRGAAGVRLRRASERARLGGLPLLARLADSAVDEMAHFFEHTDDADEVRCVLALAEAWVLARSIEGSEEPLPASLSGSVPRVSEQAEVGRLLPLVASWKVTTGGARVFTWHALDLDHYRIESVTTGRAPGADPGFCGDVGVSLLWNESARTLTSGIVTLHGAERRPDGTLSATSRTRVSVSPFGDLDWAMIAVWVNQLSDGFARTAWGFSAEPLRVIRPRHRSSLGAVELDEVRQQLVLPVTDRDRCQHRLVVPADARGSAVLAGVASYSKVFAIIAVGNLPETVLVKTREGVQLVPLSFFEPDYGTSLPVPKPLSRGQKHSAFTRPSAPDPLVRLLSHCADLVTVLYVTGQKELTSRQRDSLDQCIRDADDVGLETLAGALRSTRRAPRPVSVLWAAFVIDRLKTLVGDG